jgi:hypothetical protein
MTSDDFVRQLGAAAPRSDQLQQAGLSPRETEEFRLSYFCVPRATRLGGHEADPVLDLLSRYDLGKVEIGMVTFTSEIGNDSEVWLLGKVEVDPLVEERRTGEVRVNEGSPRGRVLWRCARDGGRFLDALLPAAFFLGQCAYDSGVSENDSLRQGKARECALAAGGNDYLDFYRMLLGCG